MKKVVIMLAMCFATLTVANASYAKVSRDATLYNSNGTAAGTINAGTEVIVTGNSSLGGEEIIWAGARAYTDSEVLENIASLSSNLSACKIKAGAKITEKAGSGNTVINVSEASWGVVTGVNSGYFKVAMGAYAGYVDSDKIEFSTLPSSSSVDRLAAAFKRAQVVAEAKKCLGVDYVYGGESTSGFDCSGLVSYVYKKVGISLPRVAEDQCEQTTPVSVTELIPGDLVFFTKNGDVHHTGIYVGDGQMIHAPYTGTVVKYTTIIKDYYRYCFYRGGRVIF